MGVNEAVRLVKNVVCYEEEGHQFALKIVKKIRNTIDKWKTTTGIGFSLYSNDDLDVSYYFANKDKKSFGNIEGINQKGFYSSCLNLITKKLSLYQRLELEKDFDYYFNGGCCHKIDISKLENESESHTLIKYIYENLLYTSFGVDPDECKVCGYKGNMVMGLKHSYNCPNCSNKDKTKFIIRKKLNE